MTNTSDKPLSTWTVTVTFQRKVDLLKTWRSTVVSDDGTKVVFTGEYYNTSLKPGESTRFGFKGEHAGSVGSVSCS